MLNVIDISTARNSHKRSINRPAPHYCHNGKPTRKVTFLNQISICPTLVNPNSIKKLQEFVSRELDGTLSVTCCGDTNKMKLVYTAFEPLPHLLSQFTEYTIN